MDESSDNDICWCSQQKNHESLSWTEFFDDSLNMSIKEIIFEPAKCQETSLKNFLFQNPLKLSMNQMKNSLPNLSPMKSSSSTLNPMKSSSSTLNPMKSSLPTLSPMKSSLPTLSPMKSALPTLKSSLKNSFPYFMDESLYELDNNFISEKMSKILETKFDDQLKSDLLQLPYDIIYIILSNLGPNELIRFALTSKYAYSLVFTEEFGFKLVYWFWENVHKLAVEVQYQIVDNNIKNITNLDDIKLINETIDEVKDYANNIVLNKVNLDIQYYLVKQIIQTFLDIYEYVQKIPNNYCSKIAQYDYHLRIILQEYDILSGVEIRKDLFNNPNKEAIQIWEKWYNDKLFVPLNDFLNHFHDWDDIQLTYLKYSIDFPISGKVTKYRWIFLATQFSFQNLEQFKKCFIKFACSCGFAGPMNCHLAKNILESFKNHDKYEQIVILRRSRKCPGTLTLTFFKTIELNGYLNKMVAHCRLLSNKSIDEQICKIIKSNNYQLCPEINYTPPELIYKS